MSVTASPPRRPGSPPAPANSSRTALLAAAVAAVAAAGLGFAAFGPSSGSDGADTAKVVVAQQSIPRGSALSGLPDGTLKVRSVALDKVAPGALVSVDALAGKVTADNLKAGEQVTSDGLAADDGVVAARLPEGQRAVTLPVDAAHGMAGDIKISDRVDVYGSYQVTQEDGSQSRPVLKVIAQDVRVLRAPPAAKDGGSASSEITVALDPKTATQAAFTADNGKLWVAARPTGSDERTRPSLVTVESLLFGVEPIVSAKSTPTTKQEVAK